MAVRVSVGIPKFRHVMRRDGPGFVGSPDVLALRIELLQRMKFVDRMIGISEGGFQGNC